MLKFINEELFSFYLEDCKNESYGEFVKLSIQSARSIVKISEENQNFIPNIRTFAKLISPDKNYSNFNLAFSTKPTENNGAQILFKCTPDVEKDSSVYLIAFPFNGIIKPIPESPNYRILKGMISVSEQYSVLFNGKKYKKILYLAVSPRSTFFKPNNPSAYIPFDIESYAYYKDREGNVSTVRETLFTRMQADGNYMSKIETDIIEPINLDMYKNQPIFTTYKRPEAAEHDTNYQSNTERKNTAPLSNVRVTYVKSTPPQTQTGGYSKPTFQDKKPSYTSNNFKNDTDYDTPKKKGGNPNRKKKTKR